jgi:hypothetical protein
MSSALTTPTTESDARFCSSDRSRQRVRIGLAVVGRRLPGYVRVRSRFGRHVSFSRLGEGSNAQSHRQYRRRAGPLCLQGDSQLALFRSVRIVSLRTRGRAQ